MDLATIGMDRQKAREKFLEYRGAVRARHDDEDAAIMAGYRALSRGDLVISLSETIRRGGLDHRGYPRLAVCRADAEWCWFNHARRWDSGASEYRAMGSITYMMDSWSEARWTRRRVRVDGVHEPMSQPPHPDVRAMVPIIPPALRPKAKLSNYHVLWEADWQKAPRPPGDPALLRRIRGDLWTVMATWDLTELERAVLGQRTG